MAYGKLCEGDRVWTAAAGPAASADINELQDQLKTMMDTRKYCVPHSMWNAGTSAWFFNQLNDPLRWAEQTHTASSLLIIPVYLPANATITAVSIWVLGAATETGGDISLMRQKTDGSAGMALVQAIDATDPWAHNSITEKTVSGMTHAVDSDYTYFIRCENATGGPVVDNYVYGCNVSAQFGN